MELDGLQVVRLKHDYPEDGLYAGDCGMIWGVYRFSEDRPLEYEATFLDQDGKGVDLMFFADEVDLVEDATTAPFAAEWPRMRQEFLRKEAILANRKG